MGSIALRVPRVRDGSYFPALPRPRTRAERGLVAVIEEADVQGVSTRRVDALVPALGMTGISTSPVSRLCAQLDRVVERFRRRRRDGSAPYLWRDATCVQARRDGKVVSAAVVIAGGGRASGAREVWGLAVGPREDGAFWRTCLRGLVARGRSGVQLASSAAPEGRQAAIAAVLTGARWPRCRGHVVRHARALVPQGMAALVASSRRTAFAQPDAARAREQGRRVADGVRARYPRLAPRMDDAEDAVRSWPSWPSRPSTGGRSGAPTPWSG